MSPKNWFLYSICSITQKQNIAESSNLTFCLEGHHNKVSVKIDEPEVPPIEWIFHFLFLF